MNTAASYLWVIPALPLAAAAAIALMTRRARALASGLAIACMAAAFLCSCAAFVIALQNGGRGAANFEWFTAGAAPVRLGWLLDPLGAVMLVMVTFVSLMVFIYSLSYMAKDENFTRFYCFLSLFAAAMLGVVVSNSLLLLFICWELVGLASFLLIGFWHHKPSAVAAARKAFMVTRVGDVGLFLGLLWLYSESGTLLCYDNGAGCMEQSVLVGLALKYKFGIALSTLIPLMIFIGAMGKSGQFPLHVWLPDAMEGPTPVSALIHAATMVAAGVFLLARTFPLLEMGPRGVDGVSLPQMAVAWVGVITALFAALVAVSQTDIKRILAYSTVSQLGFMMLGLGLGGVSVGMFHLVTHAFFKALLFLGAGSVIHGCGGEQDIRRMGGLRKKMPVTFAAYAIGMMALAGMPVFFAGFWSKDEILHAAHAWKGSHLPFYLGLAGSFLTAFYMTRQMAYVFFGEHRGQSGTKHGQGEPHESPGIMLKPLLALAVLAILAGFFGTPAWPWFESFLEGRATPFQPGHLFEMGTLLIMALSTLAVAAGAGLGLWLYGLLPLSASEPDALETARPGMFRVLQAKFYVDELYDFAVVRPVHFFSGWLDRADQGFWAGAGRLAGKCALALGWCSRVMDECVVNGSFDSLCARLRRGSAFLRRGQTGDTQHYLRALAAAFALLLLWLVAGVGSP